MIDMILASANWYCGTICDASRDGIFAYGGKNTIFLLDITKPQDCQYFGHLCGHKDRVTSVQFCKTPLHSRWCFSASEDLSVAVWDIDTKELISQLTGRHQARISAVASSLLSDEWVYSGDEKGRLISWKHLQNEVYEHFPLNGCINCISCSPDEEGIVVIGYKTGQIIVISTHAQKMDVVNVLKGHDDEIHCLIWSPCPLKELPSEIFAGEKTPEDGFILASSSRDKTIRLWNLSFDQYITVFNVPTKSSKGKHSRDDYNMKSRLWITLCWPRNDPSTLLSSGFNGDILSWNLSRKSKPKWRLFGEHSRIVFNMCHHPANDVMISVSMDRQINIWSLEDATLLTSLPCCGGFVYSLDVTALDPLRLAVAVGDNMIRIWNNSRSSSPKVTNLWRGIGTKVMIVLWHSLNEGLLAFGTEEGKVGIYNVLSQACNVSRIYHKKSVYSLSWGPPSEHLDDEGDKNLRLYSCGREGTILEHKPDRLNDVAKNIDVVIKRTNEITHNISGHTEVSCKPDGTLMAIGNEDGSILFCGFPDLKILSTINVHKRNITCLAWYLSYDTDDPCLSYLASGSNGSDIHVHDSKEILRTLENGSMNTVTSSYRWLAGHSARVTDLDWSPHSDLKLASSSYDGTVQVWDVVTGSALVNYRGHCGRVMAVVWSVIDVDVLFSGGDDFTVRSWRISQQVFKEPPLESKKPKSRSKKKKKKALSNDTQNRKDEIVMNKDVMQVPLVADSSCSGKDFVETSKDFKDLSLEENYTLQHNSQTLNSSFADEGQECVDFRQPHDATTSNKANTLENKKKKKRGKSMLPLSALADNRPRDITSKGCIEVAKFVTGSTDTVHTGSDKFSLGLFADRKSTFSMLTEQGVYHAENGNIDYQIHLELWKGNIGKALEVAVEKKQLNDCLVAFSHLAGESVRLVITEAFAEQLVGQGNFYRAALYYLACDKVYEAINVLKVAGMYRDAIALAKVRLLPSDPVLLDLYSSWGRRLEIENSYEQASKCYLACGLKDDAIRVLTRRGDEVAFHTAAQVAMFCQKLDLAQSLIQQSALKATKKARWNDALDMIHDFTEMEPLLLLICTHKTMLKSLLKSGAFGEEDFPERQLSESNEIGDTCCHSELPSFITKLQAKHEGFLIEGASLFWRSVSNDDSDFCIYKILRKWWRECDLERSKSRLPAFYVQLSALNYGRQSLLNKGIAENIMMMISKNVCLGLIAALLGKSELCLKHFLKALAACNDYKFQVICHLVELLFPFGLESCRCLELLSQNNRTTSIGTIDQYFNNIMAFYYQALLRDCLRCLKLKNFLGKEAYLNEAQDSMTLPVDNFVDASGNKISQAPDPTKSTINSSSAVEKDDIILRSDACESRRFESNHGKLLTTPIEFYRLCLICSTVLLSDIYAHVVEGGSHSCTDIMGDGAYGNTDIVDVVAHGNANIVEDGAHDNTDIVEDGAYGNTDIMEVVAYGNTDIVENGVHDNTDIVEDGVHDNTDIVEDGVHDNTDIVEDGVHDNTELMEDGAHGNTDMKEHGTYDNTGITKDGAYNKTDTVENGSHGNTDVIQDKLRDYRNEVEKILQKIPFPNVKESVSLLLDLLNIIISSPHVDKDLKTGSSELFREITSWATRRKYDLKK